MNVFYLPALIHARKATKTLRPAPSQPWKQGRITGTNLIPFKEQSLPSMVSQLHSCFADSQGLRAVYMSHVSKEIKPRLILVHHKSSGRNDKNGSFILKKATMLFVGHFLAGNAPLFFPRQQHQGVVCQGLCSMAFKHLQSGVTA